MELKLGPKLKNHACLNLCCNLRVERAVDDADCLLAMQGFKKLCGGRVSSSRLADLLLNLARLCLLSSGLSGANAHFSAS